MYMRTQAEADATAECTIRAPDRDAKPRAAIPPEHQQLRVVEFGAAVLGGPKPDPPPQPQNWPRLAEPWPGYFYRVFWWLQCNFQVADGDRDRLRMEVDDIRGHPASPPQPDRTGDHTKYLGLVLKSLLDSTTSNSKSYYLDIQAYSNAAPAAQCYTVAQVLRWAAQGLTAAWAAATAATVRKDIQLLESATIAIVAAEAVKKTETDRLRLALGGDELDAEQVLREQAQTQQELGEWNFELKLQRMACVLLSSIASSAALQEHEAVVAAYASTRKLHDEFGCINGTLGVSSCGCGGLHC